MGYMKMTATINGVLTDVYESKQEKGKIVVRAKNASEMYDNDIKKQMTPVEVYGALSRKGITVPMQLDEIQTLSREPGTVGVKQTKKMNYMAYFVLDGGYVRNMGVFEDRLEANTRAYVTALRLDIVAKNNAA